MNRVPKIHNHVLLALAALFAGGCQLAKMEVDPALADAPAMAVKGNTGRMWDRQIQFGAWRTATVKEGWTRDMRHEVGTANEVSALDNLSKRYRFDLPTTSGTVAAQCAQLGQVATHTRTRGSKQTSVAVDLAMLRKLPALQCTYEGIGGGSLKLLQQLAVAPEHAGEVEFAGGQWSVTEVARIEGARTHSVAPLSGFEIRRGGIAIAAVELINSGRVWISPSLSQLERDRAAAIVTTLLLFRPIEPATQT